VRDEALLHEDVWGSGGIASNILELGIRWRWVINFTPRPLYPEEWAPGTHWIGGWVGPVWTLWRNKSLSPVGNRTPAVQLISRRYTDWAIPAHGYKVWKLFCLRASMILYSLLYFCSNSDSSTRQHCAKCWTKAADGYLLSLLHVLWWKGRTLYLLVSLESHILHLLWYTFPHLSWESVHVSPSLIPYMKGIVNPSSHLRSEK
jgi:hypothetical protein